jgi:hypothetical protein
MMWSAGLIAVCLMAVLIFSAAATAVCRKWKDRIAVAVLLLSVFGGVFLLFQTCIYHDALWTYGYMRSALMDHDLSFFNEFLLYNNHFMYVPHPREPIFYCGAALIMAPFFGLGHLLALLLSGYQAVPLNGYSWPYTLCTSLAGVSAGCVTLILIYQINRMFFRTTPSLMAGFFMFWAGNLCFYTFVWPLYSHAFSVLAITMFLLLWFRMRVDSPLHAWLLWGLILGYAVWIRPQNALFVIVPLCEWAGLSRTGGKRPAFPIRAGCLFMFGALLAFSPQMLLWAKTAGKPIVDAYAHIGDEFFWWRPRLWYLFFSTNRGLLVWSPIFAAAVPGFIMLASGVHRRKALVLLATFLLQVYLVAAYEFPEGGAGFSSRYLINCMPFLSLCLAAFLNGIPRRWRIMSGAFFLFLVYANIGLIITYQLEMIPHNNYIPSMTELLHGALVDGPRTVWAYVTSTNINENVFARNILTQVPDRHSMWEWSAVFLVVCGGLALCTTTAMRCTAWHRRGLNIAVIMGVLLFVGTGFYIVNLKQGPEYANIWPVLAVAYDRQEAPPAVAEREIEISAKDPLKRIPAHYKVPVDTIDLTSILVWGFESPPFELLGHIMVTDEDGRTLKFDIVNDRDTAEFGAFNMGASERIYASQIDSARIVHQWLGKDDSGYYYGTGYHRRYNLSKPVRVSSIDIHYTAKEGKLIITGLTLSKRKGVSE